MHKWPVFCLALSLAGGLFCGGGWGQQRPNVVIFLVDDMGYGDPTCFNPQSKLRMPHMDRVAAAGMRFTDAHAAGPLCHLSRYGLMTGRYPFRAQVGRWAQHAVIEPGQTTLASLLRKQGYHTAMVGKWHLGFEEQGYDQPLLGGPVDVGFDSFFGIRASTDIPPYFYIRGQRAVAPPTQPIADHNSPGWSKIQGEFWRAGLIAPDLQLPDVLPRFTDEAVRVIQEHVAQGGRAQGGGGPSGGSRSGGGKGASDQADQAAGGGPPPLFLYVALPAPHTPWLPSAEFAGKSQVSLYGDFAEMVDAMLGRVLAALDETGLSPNTLLIVTSDNGPTWYPADVQRFGHDSAGGWRGMKSDAWEAGHRMPFIVRWPGVVAAGSQSQQTIGFTDVLATLARITGYTLSADEGPDSFDFSAVLRGQQAADQPVRPSLALQSGGGLMTFRRGDWKLIEGLGSGGFSEPKKIQPAAGQIDAQLYNLRLDPAESRDLASQQPQLLQELRQQLLQIQSTPKTR